MCLSSSFAEKDDPAKSAVDLVPGKVPLMLVELDPIDEARLWRRKRLFVVTLSCT